jgi:hypothetical protein
MHESVWLFAQMNMAKVCDLRNVLHDEQDTQYFIAPTSHHQEDNGQPFLLDAHKTTQLLPP